MGWNSFWLEGSRGNNAFSYDKRGKNPRLHVTGCRAGGLEDLRLGTQTVFEEYESGSLRSYVGLDTCIEMEYGGVSTVIVDNHNHAMYCWYQAYFQGIIDTGVHVVHIDQHSDMRTCPDVLEATSLDAIFDYTHICANVGNFIRPTMESGLVDEVIQIQNSTEVQRYMSGYLQAPYILDVDIDFFVPELDFILYDDKKQLIQTLARSARLITIATSPYFIDQNRAIEVIRDIFGTEHDSGRGFGLKK